MAGLLVLLGVGEVAVGGVEGGSNVLAESVSGFLVLEVVVLDFLEIKIVDHEAGGHHVVLVNVLDEGLHTGPLDEFLLAEASLDLAGVAGDTGDQKVREAMFLNGEGGTLLPSS